MGLGVLPVLASRNYPLAMALIVGNRLLDGLDGALARQRGPTRYGAYLDIVCDMLFYAAVPLGMALAQPENALWSALLLAGFLGTCSSFLAYTALAPEARDPEGRGLFFLGGLVGGSETLLFFLAFCRWHFVYPVLALAFSVLCGLTVLYRLVAVARRLRTPQA